VIELGASAASGIFLGREILANVPIHAPLAEHQLRHLLRHGLTSCAHYWNMIVVGKPPVHELPSVNAMSVNAMSVTAMSVNAGMILIW
jgi:hypothetical protein